MSVRHNRVRGVLGVMAAALVVAVTACASGPATQTNEKDFPAFVYGSAVSIESYRVAVRLPIELKMIPCYCGCGQANDHHSLKECFIKPDGTYDSHAAGCDVCSKEALDVDRWLQEGESPKAVRELIDQRYGDYGRPTDTPPPP